ncbi:DUF1203 domain-containing protein [Rhodobacteraceae bacterium NNCM2]|nr:DUF1203 domain-containing protein [Coraliihabitans acroporae]
MSDIVFTPIPTETARHYQGGGTDAYGNRPERAVSDGSGNPCRHCLGFIPKGEEMLILAHRPFDALQPYAETGPIFVCARECAPWTAEETPPILKREGEARLLKGYSAENRIVYGLGRIVPVGEITAEARALLADPRVAYVHIRSSTNNCFTCRVDRAGDSPR